EQSWRRYIHQPHRRGPGRRQSEPVIAKTIGKDQAQQHHRVFYHATLQKSAGLLCAALKKRRATKPFYEILPVLIQKRFVSHPTLNHKSIPTSKNILTPMRFRGDERRRSQQQRARVPAANLHRVSGMLAAMTGTHGSHRPFPLGSWPTRQVE